jgi:hypothetical protein
MSSEIQCSLWWWDQLNKNTCPLHHALHYKKTKDKAQMWELKPVIPTTRETEIRRITFWGQPRQNIHETLSQPMTKHSGMHLSSQLSRETQIGGSRSRLTLACSKTPSQKQSVQAGRQWLMPVILTTQKAEIGRTVVQSQPRQIVRETLSRKDQSRKGLVE